MDSKEYLIKHYDAYKKKKDILLETVLKNENKRGNDSRVRGLSHMAEVIAQYSHLITFYNDNDAEKLKDDKDEYLKSLYSLEKYLLDFKGIDLSTGTLVSQDLTDIAKAYLLIDYARVLFTRNKQYNIQGYDYSNVKNKIFQYLHTLKDGKDIKYFDQLANFINTGLVSLSDAKEELFSIEPSVNLLWNDFAIYYISGLLGKNKNLFPFFSEERYKKECEKKFVEYNDGLKSLHGLVENKIYDFVTKIGDPELEFFPGESLGNYLKNKDIEIIDSNRFSQFFNGKNKRYGLDM